MECIENVVAGNEKGPVKDKLTFELDNVYPVDGGCNSYLVSPVDGGYRFLAVAEKNERYSIEETTDFLRQIERCYKVPGSPEKTYHDNLPGKEGEAVIGAGSYSCLGLGERNFFVGPYDKVNDIAMLVVKAPFGVENDMNNPRGAVKAFDKFVEMYFKPGQYQVKLVD